MFPIGREAEPHAFTSTDVGNRLRQVRRSHRAEGDEHYIQPSKSQHQIDVRGRRSSLAACEFCEPLSLELNLFRIIVARAVHRLKGSVVMTRS